MMRDALATELRVLSGLHAGACAEAQDGLLLGAGDDADVILTDLAADAGLAVYPDSAVVYLYHFFH